ncbi:MAG: ABC transporter substrate-binding protein [Deltaproteobacteria bacterium]|nr:ABC transporter substrate-binding protein [Deltaproteobacteria bacterium]
MNKRRAKGWLGFLVIGAMVFFQPAAGQAAEDVIKIGVPAPFSGSAAEKGKHLKYGVMLAAQEINAKGGVLGKKIELVYADTEAKPEVGVSAYEKLITRDEVDFIVGEVNSHVALAVMDVVAKYGMPTLFAIPASDQLGEKILTNPEKYGCIYMCDIPVSRMQEGAFIFLEEALQEGKLKRKEKSAALVYEDSSWGRIVGETWKKSLEDRGWEIVLEEVTPFKESDYLSIVSKIRHLNPALVKIEITSLPAGVALSKQLYQAGITEDTDVFGGYYQKTKEFPQMAGPFAVGSFNVKEPYAPDWPSRLHNEYPEADVVASMMPYDSLHIMAEAIKRAGSREPDKVIEALGRTDHEGVFMRTVFDSKTHFAKVGKEYKLFGVALFTKEGLGLIWPKDYAEIHFF